MLQLLGDFVPQTPYRRLRPWSVVGDSRPPGPLWFCLHPKPPSAAFASDPVYYQKRQNLAENVKPKCRKLHFKCIAKTVDLKI